MAEPRQCSVALCEKPVVALLDQSSFCREHFISTCYAQLEAYTKLRNEGRLNDVHAESVRRFIHECTRQADLIEQAMRDSDNLERARLADIILWAADLGRHVRRSPRKAVPFRFGYVVMGRGRAGRRKRRRGSSVDTGRLSHVASPSSGMKRS